MVRKSVEIIPPVLPLGTTLSLIEDFFRDLTRFPVFVMGREGEEDLGAPVE